MDAAPTTTKKPFLKRWLTPILALVAAVGVGLFGGVFLGQATASSSSAAPADFSAGERPTGSFGGATSGTVTAVDGDTVTIELEDGSTVTVTASADTTVTTTTDAAVSDLAEGDTITVAGETDDDGNVTATSITEGALTVGGFGGGTPPTQ